MLFKKKKDNERLDMQAENIYLIEEIKETDWKSLKGFDAFIDAFIEISINNSTLRPVLDKMVSGGFNIEDTKQTLATRKALRKKIVGDKDVDHLKEEFRLNVEELNELRIDIDYYKDKFKKTKKRPYSELEFKEKTNRAKVLEDWLLDNSWIANHQLT